MSSSGPAVAAFPRRHALTGRFTHGAPRALHVSADGSLVAFLRSNGPEDPICALHVLEVASGAERPVADPRVLLAGGGESLSAAERARRERMREGGAGITGFAADRSGLRVAFALSSRLFAADLASGQVRELAAAGAVVDPRPSPDGAWIAYAAAGSLHVVAWDGTGGQTLAEPDGESVTWGLADFVASEELDRFRGFWWSPDSDALLVERVDESSVERWWISDPAHPSARPREHRYPAAGTANADVSLWWIGLDGARAEVSWDREAFPYLASVSWTSDGPALIQVLTRRQERAQVLAVEDGRTRVVREQADPCWVDVVPGVPCWDGAGRLVTVEVRDDTYTLLADGEPLTPAGLQVRGVVGAEQSGILAVASADPTERHVVLLSADGMTPLTRDPGVHSARWGGPTVALSSSTLQVPGAVVRVLRGGAEVARIASLAEEPEVRARPALLTAGSRGIRAALLLPSWWRRGDRPLPVLMDPYGGPHGPRVLTSMSAHTVSQWFAELGYAVLVADGRGTPREPSWERAVRFDLADAVLEDQVEALLAVAAEHEALDLSRVAIRGWSFGGYLAALAVLRRPDVFHAAIAGAPGVDWALYDTAYTERYLGLPDEHPEAYERSSLLPLAGGLSRPLLLIHGLADDNVLAAHTLRLSTALLAAGKAHDVLPLTGVTHMTPQVDVAENLLRLQAEWLSRALAR
jgi:dipeptidyl-peptidase-4